MSTISSPNPGLAPHFCRKTLRIQGQYFHSDRLLADSAANWLQGRGAQALNIVLRHKALRKAQTLAQVAADPNATASDLLEVAALNLDLPDNIASAPSIPGIEPHAIPFPAEALQEHPFPLTGSHATADCWACHTGGVYKDTPSACVDCHQDPHQGTYESTCERCHDTATGITQNCGASSGRG